MTAPSTAQAKAAARDLEQSSAVRALARLGLGARSVVWLVICLLVLSVALGGSEQTDQGGALRAVADQPFGTALLVVLAVGFVGHGLWRLLNAAVGHRAERDAQKRWAYRGASLARGLVHLTLGAATLRFLLDGSSQDQTQSVTARLMSATGGRVLVGVIGVVVIGIGIGMAVKGVKQDHEDELETGRLPVGLRRPAVRTGVVGLIGRGAVFGLLGLFLLRAAVLVDPREAKGLDAALQTVAAQPYGKVLLGLAVLGILAYALWSFVETFYKRL